MTPAHYASKNPPTWGQKAFTITQASTFGIAIAANLFIRKLVGRKP